MEQHLNAIWKRNVFFGTGNVYTHIDQTVTLLLYQYLELLDYGKNHHRDYFDQY